MLLFIFNLYLLKCGISTETGTFDGPFLDIDDALYFLNPSNYLVTLYYYDGYFIYIYIYIYIYKTENTPTTQFKKQNIASTILFLLKNVSYQEECLSSLFLIRSPCFIRYLSEEVRITECTQDVSRSEMFREKDCHYTSVKHIHTP